MITKNEDKTCKPVKYGAGGTLLASEDNNCNCYMMEIDPYYCQLIINRWEEYTGQKAKKIN